MSDVGVQGRWRGAAPRMAPHPLLRVLCHLQRDAPPLPPPAPRARPHSWLVSARPLRTAPPHSAPALQTGHLLSWGYHCPGGLTVKSMPQRHCPVHTQTPQPPHPGSRKAVPPAPGTPLPLIQVQSHPFQRFCAFVSLPCVLRSPSWLGDVGREAGSRRRGTNLRIPFSCADSC